MNNNIKVFIFSFCLIFHGCFESADVGEASEKEYVIALQTDTIYAKASMWGLTGDHFRIYLSAIPLISNQIDSNSTIISYEPIIYFKQNQDTLDLFPTMKVYIPNEFSKKVVVRQFVIENLDQIKMYKEKYKELGLSKISVYE